MVLFFGVGQARQIAVRIVGELGRPPVGVGNLRDAVESVIGDLAQIV